MRCRGKTGTTHMHIKHDRRGKAYRAGRCVRCGGGKAIMGGSFHAGGGRRGAGWWDDIKGAVKGAASSAWAAAKPHLKNKAHELLGHAAGAARNLAKEHGVDKYVNPWIKKAKNLAHEKVRGFGFRGRRRCASRRRKGGVARPDVRAFIEKERNLGRRTVTF